MDEIIVRVLRTVACSARLRILSSLARVAETCPSHLARELGMGIDLVSTHLARLSSAGLITRRRSGARCHCTAESPYPPDAFSGKIASWLTEAFRRPKRTMKDCGVNGIKGAGPAQLDTELHNIFIDAATAFTNVRRLQILRRLATREVFAVETLSQELGMSESAVSRHTSKLIRRAYVDAGRAGRRLEFRLASKSKTPLHGKLLEILRSEWEKE
jgi:DNA-binding transcriptional ArsR family regulator